MNAQAQGKIDELKTRLKSIQAKDIMSRNVMTTTQVTPLATLADQMIHARINGLPVLDKSGKVVGIVTTTDLLIVMGMVLEGTSIGQNSVATINPMVDIAMTSEVKDITEETTLEDIVHLMRTDNIHTFPVMREGKLVGVVGKHDVLKKFYESVHELTS